jgi:hypothetical protein
MSPYLTTLHNPGGDTAQKKVEQPTDAVYEPAKTPARAISCHLHRNS